MRGGLVPIVQERRGLALFFVIYYVGLGTYGVVSGAPQVISYGLFVAIAAAIVVRLYGRARLSPIAMWGLALWGLAHMVGGLVEIGGEVIYERSLGQGELRFDKIVHFFGFGFATLAAFEVLRATIAPDAPPRSIALGALFVGLGVGAINETIEFVITLLPAESNVGGFSNTGWDLVANAAGAVTAAVIAPALERRKGVSYER